MTLSLHSFTAIECVAVRHFRKLELHAKEGSLLKCRVVSAFSRVNIPTTNQQHLMHFPFFGWRGPFAFGQKVRFLPSFSAENSDGTIPGRHMEADKCSGGFIYSSCIYSVIANGQIFKGCSCTCGGILKFSSNLTLYGLTANGLLHPC